VITEVFCDDLPGLDVELLFGTLAGEPLLHAEHVSLRFVEKSSKKSLRLKIFLKCSVTVRTCLQARSGGSPWP